MTPRKDDRRNVGLFMFGADWRAEPTLMLCSEGARLLWIEMLLLMAESEERGFLLINGKRPTPAQIATLTRTDPAKVGERLRELEENGVFSRDRRDVVYSRRVVRDEKKAAKARENGKFGGNPKLCRKTEIPPSDNPPDKPITLTPSSNPNQESPPLAPPSGEGGEKDRRKRKAKDEEPGGFPEFYLAYPRHIGRSVAARAYGRALRSATPERIMAGLIDAKAEWARRRTEPEFIPHPSAWLKGGRWMDEYPAVVGQTGGGSPLDPAQRRRALDRVEKEIKTEVEREGINPFGQEGMREIAQRLRERLNLQTGQMRHAG